MRLTETTSFLLIGLGRLLRTRLEALLETEDLTLRHVGALGHLLTNPGMSVSDLAKRAGVTPQSMHATVRQLKARGAIVSGAKGQGRRAALSVTSEGQRLLRVAARAAASMDATLLSDAEQLQQVVRELIGQLMQK